MRGNMDGIYEYAGCYENTSRYDDIIHLPHHVSKTHPPMDNIDRAAQFSPFAALTGHEAAIRETERLTDERKELGEDSKALLDEKLRMILEQIEEHPQVSVCYFRPDERKPGGSYLTVNGKVKKIDVPEGIIIFMDGMAVAIEDIAEITILHSQ